jgi:hypothetical protein
MFLVLNIERLLAIKKQKPAAFHRQRVSKLLGEESF